MQPANELSVTFSLTEEEARWFIRHSIFREHGLLIYLSYPLFIAPGAFILGRYGSAQAAITVSLVMAFVMTVVYGSFPRRGVKRWVRKYPQAIRPQTLEIAPGGLRAITEAGELTIAWTALIRVAGTRNHLLFYHSSTQAQIIPRRAFSGPAAADAFLHAAQTWHAAALAGHPRRVVLGPTAISVLALVVLLLCLTIFPIAGALLLVVPVIVAEPILGFEVPSSVGVSLLFGGAFLGFIGGTLVFRRIMGVVERPGGAP